MEPLRLPNFDIKVKDQEVFCLIRKKWILLTPEEWVRQHFLNLLIEYLGYPKGLIRLEQTHKYFKQTKRADIVVMDRASDIFLLVECKAPNIAIDRKVVTQISEYNKILKSSYIAISNGHKHFIWENNGVDYRQLHDFPRFN